MRVSIVIPNYNTWDLVKRNIEACLKHDDELINEIIVVDDASPIHNPYVFPEKVVILRNNQNSHYTKTVNRGLKFATGDILVLLDSDAYPTHPFIEQVIKEYESNLKLGCVGFKTIDEMGRDTGNYMYEPSIWSLYIGQQLQARLKHLDFRKKKYILPFSCAVSFRKSCIEELNYFDENFKILVADIDICYRIHLSSWDLYFLSSISIFHVGGQSIARNFNRVIKFYEARWRFLRKFNAIKNKNTSKNLIIFRFRLEYIYLSIIFRIKNNGESLEKVKGRLAIIERLKTSLN